MKNISATKLVKSIKDNSLSLIQFCGDLDCLQPVKYLDNPEPDDIQKAFLFNGETMQIIIGRMTQKGRNCAEETV